MPIIFSDASKTYYPSELGQDFYRVRRLPEEKHEAQFVGFQCLACGQRHAQLDELMACHEGKRKGAKRHAAMGVAA